MPRFEVEVCLQTESTLIVEAEDEATARKLVEGLEADASFSFPPESVDTSQWDWMADITITGVMLSEEQDAE